MDQYSFRMFLLLETAVHKMVTDDDVYLDLDSIAPHITKKKE